MAVNDIPPYLKTQNNAKSDLTQVLTTRALAWSLYRYQLTEAFRKVFGTVNINGRLCYNADTRIGYQAGVLDSETQKMLTMIGASDEEIADIRVAKDDSDIDEVWFSFKEPTDDLSIERAQELYSDIVNKLTGVETIELVGVTNTYDSLETVRPVNMATTLDNHNSTATWINKAQDAYNGVVYEYPTGTNQIPISDLDYTMDIKFYDATSADVTPTDTRLLSAVKALLFLEQDRFGTKASTTKDSEILIGSTYQVTAKVVYDVTTLDDELSMSSFLLTGTQTFQEILENENYLYGGPTVQITKLWKNYLWQYGTVVLSTDLEYVSGGILTSYNGKVYLTVDGLTDSNSDDFERWIAPSYNIRIETRDLEWWEKILTVISGLFNGLYEGVYQLLRLIPYFELKEEQLIDWLVEHGKPFSGETYTREEAEEYMHKVGVRAIGITVSIILIVFSGFDWSSLGTIVADIGTAVTLFGLPALSVLFIEALLQVVNMGVMLYTSYIDGEQEFDEWKIEEHLKDLQEQMDAEADTSAETAIKLATVGTMGDTETFEVQNYIMYNASYNEFFEPKMENLEPFNNGGDYTIKYKKGL